MIKCGMFSENPPKCGKEVCCCQCPERQNCNEACMDYLTTEGCPSQVYEDDDLAVIESSVSVGVVEQITQITLEIERLKKIEEEFRAKVLKAMEEHGVKEFHNDRIKFTYVAPTTRKSIDSAKLKKLHPEVAEECMKTSPVSASVRIGVIK